jgi:hypothetical protein
MLKLEETVELLANQMLDRYLSGDNGFLYPEGVNLAATIYGVDVEEFYQKIRARYLELRAKTENNG